jgi:hypothetical protein
VDGIGFAPGRHRDGYAVGVASTSRKADIRHGAEVARALGWPTDRVGFLGALGGLIDVGAPMRRPRSMGWLLVRRRAEQARAIEAHMRKQRELATHH